MVMRRDKIERHRAICKARNVIAVWTVAKTNYKCTVLKKDAEKIHDDKTIT